MNGENWPLVIDELVEFEKWQNEAQDFTNIIDHLRWNLRNILQMSLFKENPKKKIATCERLDVETLGLWPITLCRKNLTDTWQEMSWNGPSQASRIGGPRFNNQRPCT